jgi:oleate hydratase
MSGTSRTESPNAYLVGGGIASLAAAAYLVRDGRVPGRHVHVFEESGLLGGSLDGRGSPEDGYVIRGGRMFDLEAFTCTYDLLSFIPSLGDPGVSVRDEIFAFNQKVKTHSHCRLLERGRKVDVSSPGFRWRDRLDLARVLAASEDALGALRIEDCFTPGFFETNFWFLWCTTFAFQPWHSAAEFRRYLLRFMHEFPRIHTLSGVFRTPYNQYDSIIRPLVRWLEAQGVGFETNCRVTDLGLRPADGAITVDRLRYSRGGEEREVPVDEGDHVFVTLGSMTADSRFGTMTSPPPTGPGEPGGSWALWETLAKTRPGLGRPSAFDGDTALSQWLSFTVTFRDPTFFRRMEDFTGDKPGTGALVTFKDSSWLMSVVLAYQPHFLNQPDDVKVCWGYGLFPDREGDFVHKPMCACTGAEVLTELCSHLRFTADLPLILGTSVCVPCQMPYITSQFMPRRRGERPPVVPEGSTNLALIGQFCEVPDDVVFTVEYSVRSAQTAVYSLLGLDKEVSGLYKGYHDPRVLFDSLRTMIK